MQMSFSVPWINLYVAIWSAMNALTVTAQNEMKSDNINYSGWMKQFVAPAKTNRTHQLQRRNSEKLIEKQTFRGSTNTSRLVWAQAKPWQKYRKKEKPSVCPSESFLDNIITLTQYNKRLLLPAWNDITMLVDVFWSVVRSTCGRVGSIVSACVYAERIHISENRADEKRHRRQKRKNILLYANRKANTEEKKVWSVWQLLDVWFHMSMSFCTLVDS